MSDEDMSETALLSMYSLNKNSVEDFITEIEEKGVYAKSVFPLESNVDNVNAVTYPSSLKLPLGIEEEQIDRITCAPNSNFNRVADLMVTEKLIGWGIIRRQNNKKLTFQFLVLKGDRKMRKKRTAAASVAVTTEVNNGTSAPSTSNSSNQGADQ